MSEVVQESLPDERFRSRKFAITVAQWIVLVGLPLVYKWAGIGEDVLKDVLMYTTALVSVYMGVNVIQKKVLGE